MSVESEFFSRWLEEFLHYCPFLFYPIQAHHQELLFRFYYTVDRWLLLSNWRSTLDHLLYGRWPHIPIFAWYMRSQKSIDYRNGNDNGTLHFFLMPKSPSWSLYIFLYLGYKVRELFMCVYWVLYSSMYTCLLIQEHRYNMKYFNSFVDLLTNKVFKDSMYVGM